VQGFRHAEPKYQERDCCYGRKEQERGVETGPAGDEACGRIAECSSRAPSGPGRAERQVLMASSFGQIGNGDEEQRSENPSTYTIEQLDGNEVVWIAFERVKEAADRQRREAGQKQRLTPPHLLALAPARIAIGTMIACAVMMQAAMNSGPASARPWLGRSPMSGSTAALAKWNKVTAAVKMSSGLHSKITRHSLGFLSQPPSASGFPRGSRTVGGTL
jgi:hypothetical protein